MPSTSDGVTSGDLSPDSSLRVYASGVSDKRSPKVTSEPGQPPSAPADAVPTPTERLRAIRERRAERARQRAELGEARQHGLVRRHAAKLGRNRQRAAKPVSAAPLVPALNVPGCAYVGCAACGRAVLIDPNVDGPEPTVLCARCADAPNAVVLSGPDDPRLRKITNRQETDQ